MTNLKAELTEEEKVKYKEMEIEDIVEEIKQRNIDVGELSINEAAIWVKNEAIK